MCGWPDINGHVRNMYAYTKGKIKHSGFLQLFVCVCVWLQPKAACLVCLHNLVWERRCFARWRQGSRGRLHFFRTELPKVEAGVRKQNRDVAAKQYVPFLFFYLFIW